MIRSTKVSLKFANCGKRRDLESVVAEYTRVANAFVGVFWGLDRIPTLLPKEVTTSIPTWLSARMLQCCAKQVSGIVRGVRQKASQRQFIITKLRREGDIVGADRLQAIQDANPVSKPVVGGIKPEMDSRFCTIELSETTAFDGWITLGSLGNKLKLRIPFRRTQHFNKLMASGVIKDGVRVSATSLTFMFELPDPPKVLYGDVLGIDIGVLATLSCSNGFQSQADLHGHTLDSILERMSKKTKGSNAFRRCQTHRKNYTNWSINQLNLTGVKQVNIENIKDLRRGKRSSRKLGHWVYRDISSKLESVCEQSGVLIVRKSPTYTSQRCSCCGWTQKANRIGKTFRCRRCTFVYDADLNASVNISLDLPKISRKERLERISVKGFYWSVLGQEPIAPVVQRASECFS